MIFSPAHLAALSPWKTAVPLNLDMAIAPTSELPSIRPEPRSVHFPEARFWIASGLQTIRKVDSGIDNVRGQDHVPRITP